MIDTIRDFCLKTFHGGVHIPDYKWLTQDLPIHTTPLPTRVRIPVSQHVGKPALPVVKVGDLVKTGTRIAEAQARVSTHVHASITGKVTAIKKFPVPVAGQGLCIEITGDGTDQTDLLSEGSVPLVERIRDAGIVGMGGAMFPTDIKLMPPQQKKIDAVILNCAECEPYVTSDYRLLVETPDQVVQGFVLIMDALGVKQGYIGIESNKPQAIALLSKRIQRFPGITLAVLKTKYPQGGEKQLIKAILNREVPSGGLPFDVGVVVQNVGTAAAVAEAVQQRKPLYERVVTVVGTGINKPGNWRVRIGTLFSDLLTWSGGLQEDVGMVLMGGPMMGISQYSLEVPVIKGTNAVLVLPRTEVQPRRVYPCLRCGKCVIHCPMGLNPGHVATLVEKGLYREAEEEGINDCIECGLCAFSCGAGRNMVQLMKLGKRKVMEI